MKLSKYPVLVQNEILHNMKYADLFSMSFVSKKIKELIKSSQALRFKSINRIVYGFNVDGLPMVYVPCPGGRIVTFIKQWGDKSYQLNVSGKIIDFGVSESSYCPVAFLDPCDQESIIRSLHDYFLDFFGNSVEYCWNTKYNPDHEELFIPQLENLTACSIRNEGGYVQSLKKSAAFFDKAPVFKRIELFIEKYIGRTTEVFSPDSKLFQADSLQLHQHHQKLPADLRHFQGRQAFFKCHEFNSAVWGDLVRQWTSGKALQNLEYLEATKLHHFMIDEEMMFYEFDAKRIDPTRRPPTHTVPRVFIDENETPNTRPITSHAYVVRETDNRVASVHIWQGTISFGVWDKTEEQFLRMVE